MFSRRGFLGQVGVTPQAGFGPPFGMFSPGIPSAPVLNPSGSPLFSEEITSPQRAELERHCYHCPDGSTQSLTIDEARAMGCEATDSSECESPRTAYPAVMGQAEVQSTPMYSYPVIWLRQMGWF
jgi:hypothetical protein